MASPAELEDPLYNLRQSIATSQPPILSSSDNAADTTTNLSTATHITFSTAGGPKTFPITTPTRFAPNNEPVSLRSVYFAWQNKDTPGSGYLAAVKAMNEDLPSGAGGSVQNLGLMQKVELTAWLNGDTETCESIVALEGAGASASAENEKGAPAPKEGGKAGLDHRLLMIYDGERKMGDHNSVLRGVKPTVRTLRLKQKTHILTNSVKNRTSPPTAN